MAQSLMDQLGGDPGKREDSMGKEITIPDKILHLKGIEIFEALSVSELAAVASVTEEIVHPPGEIVIKEGDAGETMYLLIKGEVSVIKVQGEDHEIELDRIGAGDYFGEMALFEDVKRSATIRTEQESRLLVLHKQEFKEIVREYPQIALNICKVLSGRIRKLHKKVMT
jgi:CRP-like cAMP-binding protein